MELLSWRLAAVKLLVKADLLFLLFLLLRFPLQIDGFIFQDINSSSLPSGAAGAA